MLASQPATTRIQRDQGQASRSGRLSGSPNVAGASVAQERGQGDRVSGGKSMCEASDDQDGASLLSDFAPRLIIEQTSSEYSMCGAWTHALVAQAYSNLYCRFSSPRQPA